MNKKIGIVLVVCLLFVSFFGCITNDRVSSAGVQQVEPDKIIGSVEQDNIKARLNIVNNPATTMWFYGLSDNGEIIFKSTVKGKVTSSEKRLEPITQHTEWQGNSPELIQADGTYGSSDLYVFWFDYSGNYFQWNGKYVLTTKPLNINTPTINFQEVTEAD